MSRRRKLLVAIGVAAVSLVAAIPFLRPGRIHQTGEQLSGDAAGLKLDAPADTASASVRLNVRLPPEPPPSDRGLERIPAAGAALTESQPAGAAQAALGEGPAPPLLPSEFPRSPAGDAAFASIETAPVETAPVETGPSQTLPVEISPSGTSPSAAPPAAESVEVQDPELSRPARRHVIRDGDSLESLAERFLGNADRAGEIFDANRGLLTRRDLLPIGVEITIPSAAR